MGTEIRRVPPGWQHPVDEGGNNGNNGNNGNYGNYGDNGNYGNFIPLFDRSYDEAVRDYEYGLKQWEEGRHPSQYRFPDDTAGLSYSEWCGWEGEPPDPSKYRQQSWTEADATHVQLYENISEGTPISPVFSTVQELGDWMSEHGYSGEDVAKIMELGRLPSGVIYLQG